MALCTPASQFCCGCSMLHGVKIILFLHFLVNAILILQAVGCVFFPQGQWLGSEGLGYQVFVAGYCFGGQALVVAAFWGVVTKTETFLRVYMLYLLACCGFVSYNVLNIFVFSGVCSSLSEQFKAIGESFACGVVRAVTGIVVSVTLGLQLYCLFVVWSYLEDLAFGGAPDLSDLIVDEDTLLHRKRKQDLADSYAGLVENDAAEYGSVYDVAADGGLGGSSRIFNGYRHEMEYPPPKGLMKVQ